jgi:hypothetical protein
VTDWDSVYAYLIAATQWTWEYIDEFLTLPRLNALQKHWRRFPPVHMTAAAFAGIKPPEDEKPTKPIETAENVFSDAAFDSLVSRYKPDVVRRDVQLPK